MRDNLMINQNTDEEALKILEKLTGDFQVFESNGTFIVPEGVTKITVSASAGGGGGGRGFGNYACGGGGGGGDLIVNRPFHVTPGSSIPITVGAGGTPSGAGGNTIIGDLITLIGGGAGGDAKSVSSTYYGGAGGTGGAGAGGGGGGEGSKSGDPGLGGYENGGDHLETVMYTRGSGGHSITGFVGGRGAYRASPVTTYQGGGGGAGFGGNGGDGGDASAGANGGGYGAGGGGGGTGSLYGGSGSPGVVIIKW